MTENDQPRPDLDAAIDVVLPALTAVTDEARAASLRRTRATLADGRGRLRSGWTASPWRWALPAAVAAALIVLVSALALWHSKAPQPGSIVEQRPPSPAIVKTAPPAPQDAPMAVAPERVARAEPGALRPERHRGAPVRATSAPATADARPAVDPVVVLAQAVQAIPEDAWNEALSRSDAPIGVAELSVAPIVVAPLVTPPIADASPAPPVQGEP